MDAIRLIDDTVPDAGAVVDLYRANHWSSAAKPRALIAALAGSDALVTAFRGARLVGLGNAISDGALVVYYPHLLVHPDCKGQGIGRAIMARLQARYAGFHQQVLMADGDAVGFYARMGFSPAGRTQSMWIYDGADH